MAGASLLVLSSAAGAHAQAAAPGGPLAAADQTATLGEIVVTARRRSESLQEVPQTVNAITADTLTKLNIQQFQDVAELVPGLTLTAATNGYTSSASLRGVDFNVNSGASATTQFYLNDAPIDANLALQAIFDVGQVEVLRGPQGTTRGEPAPSGAITLTTHKPNLSDFGGLVDVSASDHQARNVQAALNVPILKDVLAVRFAGLFDSNDVNGVRSINSAIRPRSDTSAFRISSSFEPSDRFNLNVTWQHLDKQITSFDQVYGTGSPGGVFQFQSALGARTGVTLPANYNGPPLALTDLASVENRPTKVYQHSDIVTVQADSRIFGQHLSYVGSYTNFKLREFASTDSAHILAGVILNTNSVFSNQQTTTQEIRIASDPAPGRFFDYVVGGFYNWTQRGGITTQPAAALSAVYGTPANPFTFNPSQVFNINILTPSALQEYSVFGNATFHLGSATELSVGARQLFYMSSNDQELLLGPPLNVVEQNLYRHVLYKPWIYTASLSHHFTRDLMVYFNTGSSWRAGPQEPGITNGHNDAALNSLTFLSPEKSKSYEVGLKSTFWDGRARANVALYHQVFNGFIYDPSTNIPYLSCATAIQALNTCSASTYQFTTNANATVNGVDLDTALQVTHEWNIAFQASYARGNLDNARVPCNDGDFNGVPDAIKVNNNAGFVAHNEFVAFCNSSQALSARPFWSGSIQSEYVHPIRDEVDAFIRALATITPQGRHVIQGQPPTPGYNLLNLYAGVRSNDGAWELSLYARNLFNNQTPLTGYFIGPGNIGNQAMFNTTVSGGSGYYSASLVAPREIGVNLRYAFGSR
jgi:iron complex outermembrane receptor protein